MGKETLGEFELMVLLAALRLGEEEAHAVSIVDEIEGRAGRSVSRASVYVTLKRLEKKGLVSTFLGDPLPVRGGKARRLVRIEAPGLQAVRETRAALRSMWEGLEPALEEGR